MSPMHVVLASHQQLPAKGYGGPQRVVVALTRGLAALGHRVTLLALAGSRVPEAKVVEVPARKFDDAAHLAPYVPGDADILHAHVPVKPGPPGSNLPPLLHSIHRNLKPGAPAHVNAVFLSRDHARRHGSEVFIYNGLDPAEYIFRRFPKRVQQFDLFLGNLHSAKGYHWAVEAAKHTGHRLVVAGGWRPSFTGAVKYVGEVDGGKKAALLARARCVWNPAQWDEPFGLVTIEAFLSGTPVLGTRRGALPELITPDVGALCDTMEEMVTAAQTIHTRSPEACRAHAQRFFTHIVMAEEYLRMYRHLIGNRGAGGTVPPHNIFVSRDHARRHGSDVFVYNGLDPGDYVFRTEKDDYDLFLGRLHTVKGYRWAVAAAKRTGRRLVVAGGRRPSFRRNIRYVGRVDGREKAELLAAARCLWMPALWDEPFGLTTIEALLSGTPVLGTRRGALPEVLTPAVGALCDTLDEMVVAADTIHTRDPSACRAHAERYFTHLVMAEEYTRLYRRLLETGRLPPGRPAPHLATAG